MDAHRFLGIFVLKSKYFPVIVEAPLNHKPDYKNQTRVMPGGLRVYSHALFQSIYDYLKKVFFVLHVVIYR